MPPSAIEAAASGAGPLMALGTLDRLDLLARLFCRTLVVQAVLDKCLAQPEAADACAIRAAVNAGLFEVLASQPIAEAALGLGDHSGTTPDCT